MIRHPSLVMERPPRLRGGPPPMLTGVCVDCGIIDGLAITPQTRSAPTEEASGAALIAADAPPTQLAGEGVHRVRCLVTAGWTEPPAPSPARPSRALASNGSSILQKAIHGARAMRATFLHSRDFQIPTFIGSGGNHAAGS